MQDLNDEIARYLKQEYISFHTPGHKGRRDLLPEISFPAGDLTELPGLDQLLSPNGVIAKAQCRAAEIYGANESFFLINGATAGNHAMLLSIAAGSAERVWLGRASHHSVASGLIISGLTPEYIMPVLHPDFNLYLGADLAPLLEHWSNDQAVHLTYPDYYGAAVHLAQVTAHRDRCLPDAPILVDQAHGAHYIHACFPPGALALGVDMVVQSAHKTLNALTQAALLHVRGSRYQPLRLRQCLDTLQSSSPSYLLMASLENALEYVTKENLWEDLREETEKLRARVSRCLRILSMEDAGTYGIWQVDWSKILVNTRPLGIKASICVDYLRRYWRIEPELWDEENILFVLGIGNTPDEVIRLRAGLESLLAKDFRAQHGSVADRIPPQSAEEDLAHLKLPPMKLTPRQAFFSAKREVFLQESVGQICGETVALYPPGIPLILMGEEVTPEVAEFMIAHADAFWQGWPGRDRQTLQIIDG
ncbi:MAG: amino acid decarboxylase [Peptococcaceae bacterium]|jgi:arginine/lysine/ornithine decarboxylase|nr:amino acid decarboxylase [Peptococcaceae bacterium]